MHPRRNVVDAIRYVNDNGCKWRSVPVDFGVPGARCSGSSSAGGTVASSPVSTASSTRGSVSTTGSTRVPLR
ncbi:transposase [Streptomyces cinnamoneus]|uniref:transposase n=1 Tax=Streptomyces cinnamoneus TaxID=53446 RepID=UPI003438A40E